MNNEDSSAPVTRYRPRKMVSPTSTICGSRWYDTGNPADYLVAQFASALANPQYAPLLRTLAEESAT